jgi:hypothetical protein
MYPSKSVIGSDCTDIPNFMLFSKYHLNSIEDIKTEEYRTKLYHLLGPQRVAGPKGNTGAQVTALLFL